MRDRTPIQQRSIALEMCWQWAMDVVYIEWDAAETAAQLYGALFMFSIFTNGSFNAQELARSMIGAAGVAAFFRKYGESL